MMNSFTLSYGIKFWYGSVAMFKKLYLSFENLGSNDKLV